MTVIFLSSPFCNTSFCTVKDLLDPLLLSRYYTGSRQPNNPKVRVLGVDAIRLYQNENYVNVR